MFQPKLTHTVAILILSLIISGIAHSTYATDATSAAYFTKTLRVGLRDPQITRLQQLLVDKKLLSGGTSVITGYFGPLTQKAVQAYQRQAKLKVTGQVDVTTRQALNQQLADENQNQIIEKSVVATPLSQNASTTTMMEMPPIIINDTTVTNSANDTAVTIPPVISGGTIVASNRFTAELAMGDSGEQVAMLQKILIQKKFLRVAKTFRPGSFAAATQQALLKYQRSVVVAPTGIVDEATRERLNLENY